MSKGPVLHPEAKDAPCSDSYHLSIVFHKCEDFIPRSEWRT